MDLTVTKASFFNRYDHGKTSYNYEMLIKMIRECAMNDLKSSLTRSDEEIKVVFEKILDKNEGAASYNIPTDIFFNSEKLLYVKASYIKELTESGRLQNLLTSKETKITPKTKENGYLIALIMDFERKFFAFNEGNINMSNRKLLFKLVLFFLKENSIAPSMIRLQGKRTLYDCTYKEVTYNVKNAAYLRALEVGPSLLHYEKENEIKENLVRYINAVPVFIENALKTQSTGYSIEILFKNEKKDLKFLSDLKVEDLGVENV